MKKKQVLLLLLIVITAIVGFFMYRVITIKRVVHFHAGFHVYIDGKLQNYSDQKYMSLLPCGKAYNDPKLEQLEKAHLHNQVGDVVHVHRLNATWNDLFINMRVSFEKSKPVEGYINGKKVDNILQQRINPYDRAIIFVGSHSEIAQYLRNQVSVSHILQIERGSFEDCGTSAQ